MLKESGIYCTCLPGAEIHHCRRHEQNFRHVPQERQ